MSALPRSEWGRYGFKNEADEIKGRERMRSELIRNGITAEVCREMKSKLTHAGVTWPTRLNGPLARICMVELAEEAA